MTQDPPESPEPHPARRALPLLYSVVILDLIGFGIAIPVLPFLAREFGAEGLELGAILASYAAAQFVFAPIWGRLSDRFGRRPVLLMTIAGTSASLFWLGFAGSLTAVFLSRTLAGVFAANFSVASAYITDVTEESERTRYMGMLGACFAVGFTLGPVLGGLLGHWGYGAPMVAAGALAALNFVHAAFALKEPPRASTRPERVGRFAALKTPSVRFLCLLNLALSLAVVQLETVFAFFMADRFGYDLLGVAGILFLMAVLMGGVQGGGMKALSARYEERALARWGAVVLAVSMAIVPFAGAVGILLVPLAFAAVGRAVIQPSLMSLVSIEALAEHRGSVLGTFQSFASLGRVFGPVAAGILYDMNSGAPFWFAAALLAPLVVGASRLPARGVGDGPAHSH